MLSQPGVVRKGGGREERLVKGKSLWCGGGVRHSRRGWFQGGFRGGVRWQLDALVRSTLDGRIRFSAHIHIRPCTRAHARATLAELVSAWWISLRSAAVLSLFFSILSPSLSIPPFSSPPHACTWTRTRIVRVCWFLSARVSPHVV